jgi:hypothetical protein
MMSRKRQGRTSIGWEFCCNKRKDKDKKNKKAQDEHPEAPGVMIGMNDEKRRRKFPAYLGSESGMPEMITDLQ